MTQCEYLAAKHSWPYIARCKSEGAVVIRPPGMQTDEDDMLVCPPHGVEGVRAGGTKVANSARVAIEQARKEMGPGRIHAIKMYRQLNPGTSLGQAKDIIFAEWKITDDA